MIRPYGALYFNNFLLRWGANNSFEFNRYMGRKNRRRVGRILSVYLAPELVKIDGTYLRKYSSWVLALIFGLQKVCLRHIRDQQLELTHLSIK
jgi:hypothetical protein